MYGWRIDPSRLRALREEAKLTPRELAAQIGRHENHYRKLERHQQPGETTTWAILRRLSEALHRPVGLADIGTPTDTQAAA